MKPAYTLSGKPKLVVVDGAGTLFDPGSVVPVFGFQSGFREYKPVNYPPFGYEPDFSLVMKYMGRAKLEHIKLLLREPAVRDAFLGAYDREPTEVDAHGIYESFKSQLYPAAARTEEIAGVKEAAFQLKEARIPLVMTTGYDRRMVEETRKRLPWLDEVLLASFTASDVKKARPAPFMIYRAMEAALVENPAYAVNAGDTEVDTESADNAGMPGITVASGSLRDMEARKLDEILGRRHLVVPSLIEIVNYTLDGTIAERINNLNL